jgi:hypothetical protein
MNTLNVLIIGGFFSISTIVPMDLATTKDPEFVKVAQKHNRIVPLIACPDEISEKIFSYVVDINQPMEKNIKDILAISATCRYFDNSLEWFGGLLKSYSAEVKNKMLQRTVYNNPIFWRRGNLLMACSGLADGQHSENLFMNAVERNDIYMAELLLKNGISSNTIIYPDSRTPVFFKIKDPHMATLFACYNPDFNCPSKSYPNVLWYCFVYNYRYDNFDKIIQFYLQKGVDPVVLKMRTGQCLLHHIVENFKNDRHESIKKSYIDAICHVLEATKEHINTIDNKGNTPLDILMKKLIEAEQKPFYGEHNTFAREVFDMSSLFRLYGAKTTQELKMGNE